MADQADKRTGQAPEKPKPAGYFEGETMTRRTVFALGGQAFGAAAVTVVALPVVGFALAPIFDRPEEMWEGVGSPDDFTSDTYRQAVITIVEGVGDSGKTTVYIRRGSADLDEDPNSSSRSRPAARTSAARSASSARRATSSALATAASTTSRAR